MWSLVCGWEKIETLVLVELYVTKKLPMHSYCADQNIKKGLKIKFYWKGFLQDSVLKKYTGIQNNESLQSDQLLWNSKVQKNDPETSSSVAHYLYWKLASYSLEKKNSGGWMYLFLIFFCFFFFVLNRIPQYIFNNKSKSSTKKKIFVLHMIQNAEDVAAQRAAEFLVSCFSVILSGRLKIRKFC